MDIYKLCEQGISIPIVGKLKSKGITLYDIINKPICLNDVFNSKSTYIPRIIDAASNVDLNDRSRSIFELCEYGINPAIVERLFRKGATLEKLNKIDSEQLRKLGQISVKNVFKIKVLSEELISKGELTYEESKGSKMSIQDYEKTVNKKSFELFDVLNLKYVGISNRALNCLHQIGINTVCDLLNYNIGDIRSVKNLGSASQGEIIDLYYKYIDIIRCNNNYDELLYYIINKHYLDTPITIVSLKNLCLQYDYPLDKFDESIQHLRDANKVKFTMNGIKIIKEHLIDYIYRTFSDREYDVIMKRLQGFVYEEIGKELSVTRERVRQLLASIYKNIPEMYEDKYAPLFMKYDFNVDDFCVVFNENKSTYYYLKDKYEKGITNLEEALGDSSFTLDEKNKLESIFNIIEVMNHKIVLNKKNVIEVLVMEYCKDYMTISNFNQLYNSYSKAHPQYELENYEEHAMENMLNRLSCVVCTFGRKIRYYNDSLITDNDEKIIKCLFDLSDGYYSTLYLYDNNKEIMELLDIRDEYEFHYISRRIIKDNNITFDRMPNFSIGYSDKRSFFLDKIKEMSPIQIKDYLDIVCKNYGHKRETLYSYITVEFKDYIKGNEFDIDIKLLNDKEVELLKNILTEDIYSLDDLKEIMEQNNIKESHNYMNNNNICKLDFKKYADCIIRSSYDSIDDYLNKFVNSNNFLHFNDLPHTSTFYFAVRRLEKSYDVVKIYSKEYITRKKMDEIGLTKDIINQFVNDVIDNYSNVDYFSTFNIIDIIESYKLDEYGFDDTFYESILSNIESISSKSVSNTVVFSFVKNNFEYKDFIVDTLGDFTSISITEYEKKLKDIYNIEINIAKLKSVIDTIGYYYNDILDKIYIDKQYYYKEVYENE